MGLPSNSFQSAEGEMLYGDEDENEAWMGSDATALDSATVDIEEAVVELTEAYYENDASPQPSQTSNPEGALAVDDFGNAAWVSGGVLSIVSIQGRAWRNLLNSGVQKLSFDRRGRLFVSFENSILCFSSIDKGARILFKASLYRPIALLRGPAGDVRVLGRQGVYAIDEENGTFKLRRLIRVQSADAAVVLPLSDGGTGKAWLVADTRGLIETTPGEKAVRRVASSVAVEKMWVDTKGEILVFASRGGWRKLVRGSFVTISRFAVAVDAVGRFWESDPFGLTIPGERTEKRADLGSVPSGKAPPNPAFDGVRFPTPPPCRYVAIPPFPEVRFNFSMTRTDAAQLRDDHSDHRMLGYFFGAVFTWRIGNEDITACRTRNHQYQNERLRLTKHALDTAAGLTQAEQSMNEARSLKEAVAARTARDKLTALLEFN